MYDLYFNSFIAHCLYNVDNKEKKINEHKKSFPRKQGQIENMALEEKARAAKRVVCCYTVRW